MRQSIVVSQCRSGVAGLARGICRRCAGRHDGLVPGRQSGQCRPTPRSVTARSAALVGYSYNIGTYDVTNSQYVEFLNTKDPTGANTLGSVEQQHDQCAFYGGINFNAGNANGSKYSVISGDGNHPVNYVTWYDAIRFANWLNNGQGNGDTETGAYTLLGGTPSPSTATASRGTPGRQCFFPAKTSGTRQRTTTPHTQFSISNIRPAATRPRLRAARRR